LANRTPAGLFEPNSREWYQTSYPLRTLMAGYDIFGQRQYLDAVLACLDKFVGEQLPNGAWSFQFSGQPSAERTAAELKKLMDGTTNLADVGSISTCLAAAYPYADAARKKTYRDALRRFCDDYAARFQLPTGAFTNGRWSGQDMTTPYSVATGVQAMNFCALLAITGDGKYLRVAERAVRYLLANWNEDGRQVFDHHKPDLGREVLDIREKSRYHGGMGAIGCFYYSHDGILWVWQWTKDEALKEQIRKVYTWHIKGSHGLLKARDHGVWWPLSDVWSNSKMGALLTVLIEYDRSMARDPEVRQAIDRGTTFLCHPEFARRIGILCDPGKPWGKYALPATGFAGLSLAELLKPGVIFLKSDKAQPAR
jgi:hypothetical protein